jgi:hypothetical protein
MKTLLHGRPAATDEAKPKQKETVLVRRKAHVTPLNDRP